MPIFGGDSVIGAIGLANRHDSYPESFTEELKPLSQTIGLLIGKGLLAKANMGFGRVEDRGEDHDLTTSAPSGAMVTDLLAQELASSVESKQTLSVCVIDIDDFKYVNDEFGQTTGDELLGLIAQRLKHCIRPTDSIAKLQGDEFLVLLRNADRPSAYQRLLDAIAEPIANANHHFYISASMGVTVFPDDGSDADILLRHASHALYVAKESTKGQYCVFDVGLHQSRVEHSRALADIGEGFQDSQFKLFYQPKYDLKTGEIAGFEALVRWLHPTDGLLLPGEFLVALESTRYERDFGHFAIRTALSTLQAFETANKPCTVSVNISPRHFLHKTFVSSLQSHLRGFSTPIRRRLILEVLESTAIDDLQTARNTVEACQAFGVSVSLDDFGTGFSSLTYLRDLPVDEIKIDKSFVHGMLVNSSDTIIVESIIDLAKRFNRRVVAEGVETQATAEALRRLGCDYAQGFYFSEAVPLEQIAI